MRIFVVLAAVVLLCACSLPVFFRVPVVQGNVVTAENVNKLETGMTKRQVEYVMGTPLVDSGFETDRWDYVFYYRDPRAHVRKSDLKLYFVNGKLADIAGNEEYTTNVLGEEDADSDRDTPLPTGVTPGPNNPSPATPDTRRGPADQPLGAPLPGT